MVRPSSLHSYFSGILSGLLALGIFGACSPTPIEIFENKVVHADLFSPHALGKGEERPAPRLHLVTHTFKAGREPRVRRAQRHLEIGSREHEGVFRRRKVDRRAEHHQPTAIIRARLLRALSQP